MSPGEASIRSGGLHERCQTRWSGTAGPTTEI